VKLRVSGAQVSQVFTFKLNASSPVQAKDSRSISQFTFSLSRG
jgi:hypothetical protein